MCGKKETRKQVFKNKKANAVLFFFEQNWSIRKRFNDVKKGRG